MSGDEKFACRTVRQGRVKIGNKWFRPREEYNGELNGMRLCFGRYKTGHQYEPYVSLWGTEEYARTPTASWDELPPEPHVDEDGYGHWMWWYEEGHAYLTKAMRLTYEEAKVIKLKKRRKKEAWKLAIYL